MNIKKILTILFFVIGYILVEILLAKVLDDYPPIILIVVSIICAALFILIIIATTFTAKNPTSSVTATSNNTQATPVRPSTQNNSSKKEHGAGYYFGKILMFVLVVVILCALAFGVVWFYNFACEYFHKQPTENTASANNSGQKETTYYFSDYPDGKISRYLDLTHGARWEILGEIGQIVLIKTPIGGKPWEDQHGVNYTRPVTPNGTFTFWADPKHPGALGIKIILP